MNNTFTRIKALELINSWTSNPNLIKHMLAVEAEMRALAEYFCTNNLLSEQEKRGQTCTELVELWGITGLVHDADYEMFADDPKKHPSKIFDKLHELNADQQINDAVRAHAWGWSDNSPEPEGNMQWSLYCCDELSGFIIACALVRPDKKLASLTVDSVLKKFPQKAFAAAVHRDQIKLCEQKLNIPLDKFVEINLTALQNISEDLGL